eukprot:TRINITY_DN11121_c0_g1_i1.p1 TRINITY_DN11121_c0_g1~~TRINITY_DN11121_c0_g1_i1.p1  ORF type:complete len:840 (-),score=173.96 TRINITY_DN11121_c0_g1_i1:140-2659(-)
MEAARAVEECLQEIEAQQAQLQQLGEIGSPGDDDLEQMEITRNAIAACKLTLGQTIPELGDVELSTELLEKMTTVFEKACTTGDSDADLVEIFTTMWRPEVLCEVVNRQGLLSLAVADGNPQILRLLLDLEGSEVDPAELIPLACYNATQRIPLLKILLEHSRVQWDDVKESCGVALQEMFEDVCQRRNDHEDQEARIPVLEQLLQHPHVSIDLQAVDVNGQTAFTRAVMGGDTEILDLLYRFSPTDLNAELADNSTYLMRAVFMQQPESVRWLLSHAEVDVSKRTPTGTALEVAKLRPNATIQTLLEGARHKPHIFTELISGEARERADLYLAESTAANLLLEESERIKSRPTTKQKVAEQSYDSDEFENEDEHKPKTTMGSIDLENSTSLADIFEAETDARQDLQLQEGSQRHDMEKALHDFKIAVRNFADDCSRLEREESTARVSIIAEETRAEAELAVARSRLIGQIFHHKALASLSLLEAESRQQIVLDEKNSHRSLIESHLWWLENSDQALAVLQREAEERSQLGPALLLEHSTWLALHKGFADLQEAELVRRGEMLGDETQLRSDISKQRDDALEKLLAFKRTYLPAYMLTPLPPTAVKPTSPSKRNSGSPRKWNPMGGRPAQSALPYPHHTPAEDEARIRAPSSLPQPKPPPQRRAPQSPRQPATQPAPPPAALSEDEFAKRFYYNAVALAKQAVSEAETKHGVKYSPRKQLSAGEMQAQAARLHDEERAMRAEHAVSLDKKYYQTGPEFKLSETELDAKLRWLVDESLARRRAHLQDLEKKYEPAFLKTRHVPPRPHPSAHGSTARTAASTDQGAKVKPPSRGKLAALPS